MLVAFSVLAVSLSFLVYHRPPSTWRAFLARLGYAAPRTVPDSTQRDIQKKQRQPEPQGPSQLSEKQRQSSPSPPTTPKAVPLDAQNAPAVPTFTLHEHEDADSSEGEEDNLPPPSFPALNSAQRASAPTPSFSMPPPTRPNLMAPPALPGTSSLMPPPRVTPSNLRALPTPSHTSGPLPNRGPIPNRGPPSSSGSLGLPPNTPAPNTPNARGRVLLKPGHSPLDWANLQRSGQNLSGVNTLLRVTPAMLKEKNGRKGRPAWSSYQGRVYNISPYLPYHPGGEGELRRAAGKDGTKLFMEVHPWVNWENMLGECVVGVLVSEEQGRTTEGLEDMD